jgi:hypothetical protein
MTDMYDDSAVVLEPFAGQPLSQGRIRVLPFASIALSTECAYLVKELVPREGLIVAWGPPKCGKSFWTFDLIMHVALGREYRGRRVVQGPVVYVACEGASGLRARIAAFRQERLNGQAEVPFYLVPEQIGLPADREELIAAIRSALGDQAPVAVVLDTLNRSIQGSENDPADMGAFVKAADAIRAAFNCAVIIVHHCGTEGSRPRGHTSLTGAADAQLAVTKSGDGLVTVKVEYMKDGPEGETVTSRLVPVEVGRDEDGDSITSCVVEEADSSGPVTKPLSPNEQVALDALVYVIDQKHLLQAETSNNITESRTSARCPVVSWREEFNRRQVDGPDTKPDTLLKRFNRAAESLKRRGKVGFYDAEAWLVWDSRT